MDELRVKKGFTGTTFSIDASKIRTLQDVMAIIGHMNLVIRDDGSDEFDNVSHLYKEEEAG